MFYNNYPHVGLNMESSHILIFFIYRRKSDNLPG